MKSAGGLPSQDALYRIVRPSGPNRAERTTPRRNVTRSKVGGSTRLERLPTRTPMASATAESASAAATKEGRVKAFRLGTASAEAAADPEWPESVSRPKARSRAD